MTWYKLLTKIVVNIVQKVNVINLNEDKIEGSKLKLIK